MLKGNDRITNPVSTDLYLIRFERDILVRGFFLLGWVFPKYRYDTKTFVCIGRPYVLSVQKDIADTIMKYDYGSAHILTKLDENGEPDEGLKNCLKIRNWPPAYKVHLKGTLVYDVLIGSGQKEPSDIIPMLEDRVNQKP